jgi:hypothetical protein
MKDKGKTEFPPPRQSTPQKRPLHGKKVLGGLTEKGSGGMTDPICDTLLNRHPVVHLVRQYDPLKSHNTRLH